jgi:AraC-like DNA-binding protein
MLLAESTREEKLRTESQLEKRPSTSPDLEHLERLASRLPDPSSYFQGENPGFFEPPNNVIVFHRSKASMLGQEHHYHYRFVMIVNLKATCNVLSGNHQINLQPGEALLIFPHQAHHFITKNSDSLSWIFISFELNHPEKANTLRNRIVTVSPAGLGYLKELVDAYAHKHIRTDAGTSLSLLLGLVLIDFMSQAGHPISKITVATPPIIDQIVRFVWDNFDKEIKLAALAERFPYSESHLRLMFRKRMGISICTFIQKVKVNRARSMLLSTANNVSEIADACGYPTLYAFSRSFKRSTGHSPRDYRKLKSANY